MKNIILYSFLLFSAMSVLAQNNFFNKSFKSTANIGVNNIINASDDGFIAIGGFDFRSVITKLDKNANVSWSKQVEIKNLSAKLEHIISLKDGNYLVNYNENDAVSQNRIRRLAKMNSTMTNVIWCLQDSVANGSNFITAVKELKNGNIIICIAGSNISARSEIYTLSPNGNIIWQKTFQQSNPNEAGTGFSEIVELNDGQLMLVGTSARQTPVKESFSMRLCKIASIDGTLVWQKEYTAKEPPDESLSFLKEDKDGNLYFSYRAFVQDQQSQYKYVLGLCKIGKDGEALWLKEYYSKNVYGAIINKPDGTFLGCFSDTQILNYILNIDENGEVLQQHREIMNGSTVFPTFDTQGNLILLKRNDGTICSNVTTLERRKADGKGLCSFESNLVATPKYFAQTKIVGDLFPSPNIASTLKSKTIAPFSSISVSTINRSTKCQDTTFVNRCEGDTYNVGNSSYDKDGIYIDRMISGVCIYAVVTKLKFFKKNISQLDTTLTCGKSLNFSGVTYNKSGTYAQALFNKFGCDSIFTLNLKITNPKPSTIDSTICKGKSVKIGSKEFTKTGDYKEVLKNNLGCDSIVNLQLKVSDFEFSTPDSLKITEGEEATLTATSTSKQVTYEWSPPDNLSCEKCPKTIAKPSQSIDYTVKGVNKDGCEAEAKVNIKVFKKGEVFIPTAFSPDDNGTNDFFSVFGNQGVAKILDYSIFDRWGNQIFNQKNVLPNDPISGWDGKYKNEKAQQGVYIYSIKIEMANGKVRDFSGDVLLN